MKNSYKIIRGTFPPLVLYFFFGFSSFSLANQCEDLFGSRLYFAEKAKESAREDNQVQPNFFDLSREIDLIRRWDEPPPSPDLLTALLPKDVHFINHQLFKSESFTVIKSEEIGEMIMARAHWSYKGYAFGSNVAFSKKALLDNLEREGKRNYLASSQAKAVIFYFHGGGTTTTGAHTANHMISHFAKYGVDVVAVDLPWHGEGHRHFLNNLEMEISALGTFAQKFIPHNVPLFVAGHSWGGVFAEKIMRMSDRPKDKFFFHPNLKGAIIMSTAITDLPGKESLKEVQVEYAKRTVEVLTNRVDEFPADEMNIWTGMVMDGKVSFLGGLYAKIMFQMSQEKPVHEGRDYIPALMVVGKNDPLVYIGFEKEYELYRDLKNVKTVYLDPLPTRSDPSKKEQTGHLLGDRLHKDSLDEGHKVFVHFAEMRQFIAEVLQLENLMIKKPNETNKNTVNESQQALAKKDQQQMESDHDTPKIVFITQEWANNLSFRQFLRTYIYRTINTTNIYVKLMNQQQTIKKDVTDLILLYTPKNMVSRILKNLTNNINDLSGSVHLYRILESADFIRSIGNQQIAQDLTVLYDQIKSTTKSSSPDAIAELKTEIDNFESRHQSWLQPTRTIKGQLHNMFSSLTNNINDLSGSAHLYRILESADFIRSIEDPPEVAKDLTVLYDQIKSATESSSPEAITKLRSAVTDFKKTHQSWLGTPATIPRGLIKRVFREKTVEDALRKLESSIVMLPADVRQLVLDLLNRYYQIQILSKKGYIPSKDEVNWDSMTPGEQLKTEERLKRVSTAIQNLRQFSTEQLEIKAKIADLAQERNNLLDGVKHHIKVIGEFLKKITSDPPPSLKEEYARLDSQFESLQESAFQLDKITDVISLHIFEKQQPMKQNTVLSLLTPDQQAHIQQFTNLFNQYIKNRANLIRKTIVAIERGEIRSIGNVSASAVRASVIALYGIGSTGKKTKISSNSLYQRLEEVTKQLAREESRLYKAERLMLEEQDVYNSAMNQWLNYTDSESWSSRIAPLLFSSVDVDIQRNVLSGQREHINTEKLHIDPVEMAKVIQLFRENASIFASIVKKWNSLKSDLPPLLPTEKQNL